MIRLWSTARFLIPLPPGHRFPLAKYALVREAVVARGIAREEDLHEPERARWDDLALAHTSRWLGAMRDGLLSNAEARRLGFPWSEGLLERSLRTVRATLEAARTALTKGASASLAGGTHHAHPDFGEGYCCFNDVAVAIRVLQRDGIIRRAAVLDLDVHQGNGTAEIFAGEADVFTFSMHGARNFPFRKSRSSLDLELDDATGDALYLAQLGRHLPEVLDQARPDIVFYLAGADPYVGDRLGRLALSIDGLARRDRTVFQACRARGLPLAMVMAGGYAANLTDLVTINVNSVAELARAYA
jgi:acetoin utilization deacetylase AcuC-like enzyme